MVVVIAEVVSKEGLLFTNHHCGYDAIAALSTPEKNYLKDGFFAMNNKEELPAKKSLCEIFSKNG